MATIRYPHYFNPNKLFASHVANVIKLANLAINNASNTTKQDKTVTKVTT